MKKILAIVLTLALILSIAACQEGGHAPTAPPFKGELVETQNFSFWVKDGWEYKFSSVSGSNETTIEIRNDDSDNDSNDDSKYINISHRPLAFLNEIGAKLNDSPSQSDVYEFMRKNHLENHQNENTSFEFEDVKINDVNALKTILTVTHELDFPHETYSLTFINHYIADKVNYYTISYTLEDFSADNIEEINQMLQTFTLNPNAVAAAMPIFPEWD